MVTVRDRDSMEQVRIKIDELDAYFADKILLSKMWGTHLGKLCDWCFWK